MVVVSARTVTETMKIALTVRDQATASNVTVLAPKANGMSDNGEPEEKEKVTRLLNMLREQKDVALEAEGQVMKALWNLRGSYTIEDMTTWTRWSRQTIYNKWRKHGLEVNNAQP